MEKDFKDPGLLEEIQGSSNESRPSSETPVTNSRRPGEGELAHASRRKRIRAYQKIDYWQ
jgi:hypothetical protein